jgi:hypothetical protein
MRGTTLLQAPQFASVELTPSPAEMPPSQASSATSPPPAVGSIEIVLAGGIVVRVDAHVDGRALRRVLGALAER